MSMVSECGIDIFAGQLPAKTELYKLCSIINSDESNRMSFVQQAQAAANKGNNLAAGIAFAMLNQNIQAVEQLEKAKDCHEKFAYMALALRRLGNFDAALKMLDKAAKGADGFDVVFEQAAVLRDSGKYDKAMETVKKAANLENVSADYHYELGRLLEVQGQYEQAIGNYEKAIELNPEHSKAMFHLAYSSDLRGDEDAAIDYYNQLIANKPAYVSALLNLAILYEDRQQYERAYACIEMVLRHHPNHPRALLFRKDIASSMDMVFDEEKEKRIGKHNMVLETPISDFELSVRSRNCLRKMNIRTLGDLARISESELLSYKNFGETSLKEIKAIMDTKRLKLGEAIEDKKDIAEKEQISEVENEMLSMSVSELELSVRARKAVDRLGIRVLGDLTRRTEAELLGCKNFGVTSLNEIKLALTNIGLNLRQLG